MFGLFRRDPLAKLQRDYEAKLREARDLQRGGDIVGAAKATAQAEAIGVELEAQRAAKNAAD